VTQFVVTPQLNEPGSDEGSVKAVIPNVFSLLFLVCFQFIVILRGASRKKIGLIFIPATSMQQKMIPSG